ncbi:MAG: peptidoglycan DD-metalloendopeptidase family protein [Lachnospiraceae bacterium]|nr:peptidoglycan DD-metalloendopeptidase family protein [Lachnospiraceae bacterium]
MLRDKHKRKISHVVLVTSDDVDSGVKQFKISSRALWILIGILCVLIGFLLGYIGYEETIWAAVDARSDAQQRQIETLLEENGKIKEEKLQAETELVSLNETVQILGDTVNQKTKELDELHAKLDKQSTPTEFPLNGSATMEEGSEGDPICIFTVSVGTMVVATASGTVTGVNDDVEYGHNIWIDHGNGYVTIYRNAGEALVEQGDSVVVGAALFEIEKGHEKLGYQMMKDGTYIDPMELLSISG